MCAMSMPQLCHTAGKFELVMRHGGAKIEFNEGLVLVEVAANTPQTQQPAGPTLLRPNNPQDQHSAGPALLGTNTP